MLNDQELRDEALFLFQKAFKNLNFEVNTTIIQDLNKLHLFRGTELIGVFYKEEGLGYRIDLFGEESISKHSRYPNELEEMSNHVSITICEDKDKGKMPEYSLFFFFFNGRDPITVGQKDLLMVGGVADVMEIFKEAKKLKRIAGLSNKRLSS